MELHPEQALDQLERDYKAYLTSPVDRRAELAIPLKRAISRGEIEAANIRDVATDVENRLLQKRLLCALELARGSMPRA